MHLKLSKRVIQKTAEATSYLIGNKITDKITKIYRNSPQNSSKTFESERKNKGFDKEIPKETYISPKERQKIIDEINI